MLGESRIKLYKLSLVDALAVKLYVLARLEKM